MNGNRVGERFGDYRLLRRLGGGGFGEVYLGEHIRNHRSAAIKVLNVRLTSEADLKAFLDEARVIRFRHDHIVRLLDFNVANGIPYIVMDYASGGTLRSLHPRNTRVPLLDIVSYVLAIAAALQYAHYEHNTLHRDVKPANMLIDENNNTLLSDFGIAIVLHNTPSPHTPPVPLGSPSYMAPEQILGNPCEASDQYALAICAYEWLTGGCPFTGSVVEIYSQHILKVPPSLCSQVPELPAEVERVVLKALAKKPEDRYNTVQDFATALQQAADPHQSMIKPPAQPPQPPPPRPPPRPPVLRIVFAIILILFVSLSGIFLYGLINPGSPRQNISQLYPPITPSKTNDAGIITKPMHSKPPLYIGIADSNSPVFTSDEYTENNYISNGEQCIDATNAQQKSQKVFTVIAVTTLSKINDSVSLTIGNEELQGICLWQQHNLKTYPLRILIANIGTQDTKVLAGTVPEVTKQIIQFAKNNKNFLGVVGFSFSQSVTFGMDALNKADIPVVSLAASANFASYNWSYFYRIVPNADTEGYDAANYARNTLKAQQAFLFYDSSNPYSNTLGMGFTRAFGTVNNFRKHYSVQDDATQPFYLNEVKGVSNVLTQTSTRTIVFCACYAKDFSKLLQYIPPTKEKVFLMGGEAAYELGAYPKDANNYANIYFTAFSFPDTIQKQCISGAAIQCQQEQLNFAGDYCQQFSSDIKADCMLYDTGGRPGPHAIQTYDAIYALLQAYTQAKKKASTISRESVQQAFSEVSFEGISGHIDFKNTSSPSDPNNKAVLVLCVDSNHRTNMLAIYGQFLNSTQDTSNNSQGVQYNPYTICQ